MGFAIVFARVLASGEEVFSIWDLFKNLAKAATLSLWVSAWKLSKNANKNVCSDTDTYDKKFSE